jgi:dephospho-CoA kinase
VLVIGVTGRMGTGKSALCAILARRDGCAVVDADRLGHRALEDPDVRAALVARFGSRILGEDGKIERPRLAGLAFQGSASLRALNEIVHPWIVRRVQEELAALRAGGTVGIVLLDAALLLDWKDAIACDGVVVVRCPEAVAIARLTARGMSEAEARRRLAAQAPEETLIGQADWIVENGGGPADLEREAQRLWESLQRREGGKSA